MKSCLDFVVIQYSFDVLFLVKSLRIEMSTSEDADKFETITETGESESMCGIFTFSCVFGVLFTLH